MKALEKLNKLADKLELGLKKFAQESGEAAELEQAYKEYLALVDAFITLVQTKVLQSEALNRKNPTLVKQITGDVLSFVNKYRDLREQWQRAPQDLGSFRIMAGLMEKIYLRVVNAGLLSDKEPADAPVLKELGTSYEALKQKSAFVGALLQRAKKKL